MVLSRWLLSAAIAVTGRRHRWYLVWPFVMRRLR
jgi:hypothetical protein